MNEEIQRLMSAEQVRQRLHDRKLSYVAERCDLTYMSLSRLVKGNTPSVGTLEKLTNYFERNP